MLRVVGLNGMALRCDSFPRIAWRGTFVRCNMIGSHSRLFRHLLSTFSVSLYTAGTPLAQQLLDHV